MECHRILLSSYYGTGPTSLDIISFNPNLIQTGLVMVTTHLQKQKWRPRMTAQTHNKERSEVRFEPLAHRPHHLSFSSLSGHIGLTKQCLAGRAKINRQITSENSEQI